MFAPPHLLFPVRHKKQSSIGGPPKALLGGPNRKPVPLPPPKPKRVLVNLPPSGLTPLSPLPSPRPAPDVLPVDPITRDIFPQDVWRRFVPDTIDVFLPGQHAWDLLHQQAIERRLEQLGVERGSGSSVPHIYAPHARAASISSPADPALLLFKLNKLQQQQQQQLQQQQLLQQQQQHQGTLPRFFPPRHIHSMSLAQPPSYHPMPYHTALSPAPRPPVTIMQPALSPNSLTLSRSRPDFIHGFILDTPEEADEDAEVAKQHTVEPPVESPQEPVQETILNVDRGTQSRAHSRRESKFSLSLSVPSRIRTPPAADVTGDLDMDAAGDWTGSEDFYPSESSDNESIGEWSNPSDEERARKDRAERRVRRRDKPRRLPNFPKPPKEPNVDSLPRPLHPQSNLYDRDEDVMSNPSEEYLTVAAGNFYASQSPLPPPLKHSRTPSIGQYSTHDPAQAHSRTSSDTFGVHYQQQHQHQHHLPQQDPQALSSSPPTLNPFAKPFVFGPGCSTQLAPPNAPLLSHSPLPSTGSSAGARASISSVNSLTTKPLNISAPEFKPTGFTFRPPSDVPQMPSLQIPTEHSLGFGLGPTADGGWGIGGNLFTRPLPAIPTQDMREQQGREKRQRRNSSSGDIGNTAIFDEGDSLKSFRFPANVDSPKSLRSMRRSMSDASVHQRVLSSDKENRNIEPFSYAAFSTVAALPYIPLPKEGEGERAMQVEQDPGRVNGENTITDDSTARNDTRLEDDQEDGTGLFRSKKRPPLPLDFRQETARKNTVPAGLFKALANGNNRDGDERTRKMVRSRLGSRDFFDEQRKPSLDDINVPRISSSLSRNLFFADKRRGLFGSGEENGEESESELRKSLDDHDVFSVSRQQHHRRGSSLPDDLHDVEEDDVGRMLAESPGLELTTREDMQDFEERLMSLIEDKFGAIERAVERDHPALSSQTDAMIADMVSLFRAQLQENAARSLDDSQMDARGEMDLQLIKDIINQSHRELADILRREFGGFTTDRPPQCQTQQVQDIVVRVVEDVGSRTVSAIVETIADFSSRQEAAVNRVASAPAREREALVDKLISVLSPMLQQSRVDPIDYEFLTSQLAQAVKPHITQLIDLAADKRETAGLIVDQILPLLPPQPHINVDALTLALTSEVRRVIAPIDAHEIKEQVADLVIERLDSRLAVRDKSLNVDAIAESVVNAVRELVAKVQSAVQEQKMEGHGQMEELSLRITELPAKFAERIDGFADAQDKILSKLDELTPKTTLGESVKVIEANFEQLSHGQKALQGRDEELLSLNKEILDKLLSLPDALVAASNVLSDTHSELASSFESSRREADELRKLNAEYQVQVAKARSAHGQIRVEKDAINEKLLSAEADKERLRVQLAESHSEMSLHTTEITSLKIRNVELEEALAQALAKLQAADLATSTTQQRVTGLEQANRDLNDEKQALQVTAESLNMQLNYANGEKEATAQALARLQKQTEELTLQQCHWDSLRQAAEKIDALANLIGQADNDELKELRFVRDHAKQLEAEHATSQKRVKDAETKAANSERAATTTRQALTQAQQRSVEWERRTKEVEGHLELTRTKLEQAEQSLTQTETDLSIAKLQLEEREAEDRLAKDGEAKLREQIAALEAKMIRIQTELEQAKMPKASGAAVVFRTSANGNGLRSDSRASTVYDNMRSPTPSQRHPVSQASFNGGTPPPGTVWDSMHAPRAYPTPGWPSGQLKRYPPLGPSTPRGPQNTHHLYGRGAPSPTPSTVSAAPTQGEDGWWR